MTNADNVDDLTPLDSTSTQVESLLHSLMQLAGGSDLHEKPIKQSSCVLNEKDPSPLQVTGL